MADRNNRLSGFFAGRNDLTVLFRVVLDAIIRQVLAQSLPRQELP